LATIEELAGAVGDPAELEWVEFRRPAPAAEGDAVAQLKEDLSSLPASAMPAGSRVAVAVGSRGIARLADVVSVVVAYLRACGAEPVIIPAMGSHGGATPDGQVKVLHALGVTEDLVGAPIEASMEVEQVGRLSSGQGLYTSKAALGCDSVVLVNRIKPHTEFRAPIESGLTKMLTVGLGKDRGASSLHSAGFDTFRSVLPEAAGLVLARLPVPFGVALLEDSWHRLVRAKVVTGDNLLAGERALLTEAWSYFGRLPFESVEVLIVREMGKAISGTGMDPNVTGRFPEHKLGPATDVQRLVVLDLADGSSGNAVGMGMADIVTERLRSKVDWAATYANVRASKALANARLPVVVNSDHEALALALHSLTGDNTLAPRVAAVRNTLEVNHFAVSPALGAEAERAGFSQVDEALRAEFGPQGQLLRIGGLDFSV
jgi:hypothetical protein